MLEEMMPRWVPTENVNGFEICPGLYRDEGATALQSAVNFTVHSRGSDMCTSSVSQKGTGTLCGDPISGKLPDRGCIFHDGIRTGY